jgi:hypothetical protein
MRRFAGQVMLSDEEFREVCERLAAADQLVGQLADLIGLIHGRRVADGSAIVPAAPAPTSVLGRLASLSYELTDRPLVGRPDADGAGALGAVRLLGEAYAPLAAGVAALKGWEEGYAATAAAQESQLHSLTKTAAKATQLDALAKETAALKLAVGQAAAAIAGATRQLAELTATVDGLAQSQRAVQDQVDAIAASYRQRAAGADAFALLVRLLQSPEQCPPLRRRALSAKHGEAIVFAPKAVTGWLTTHGGVKPAELDGVRRAWRRAGLVPSAAADNFAMRLRTAGGAQRYFVCVPVGTYQELRVPVPRGLSLAPPD